MQHTDLLEIGKDENVYLEILLPVIMQNPGRKSVAYETPPL